VKDNVVEMQTFKNAANGRTVLSFSVIDTLFRDHYSQAVIQSVMNRLVDELVKLWIERHGPEVIETLAPGALQQAINDALRAKFVHALLGNQG
jgi:hypothetical protein